MEPEGSLPYS